MLVIGGFIAWVTRKVKVHSLNDSHFVCMAIYSIVVCVIVGIPLAFLIDGHVDALVGCLSFFLLLPTTLTLCLLFVPKVRGTSRACNCKIVGIFAAKLVKTYRKVLTFPNLAYTMSLAPGQIMQKYGFRCTSWAM